MHGLGKYYKRLENGIMLLIDGKFEYGKPVEN